MRRCVAALRLLHGRARLDTIRGRILALAVLAALVPALVTSTISYIQNRAALTEKIEQELLTTGSQAGREVDVWVKEHLYDLRVFASSYVISGAVGRAGGAGRVVEYLQSVRSRFSDYEELQLLDMQGRLLASSRRGARPVRMREGWARTIVNVGSLVEEPYWDEQAKKRLFVMAVPIFRPDGRPVGTLVARTNLSAVAKLLEPYASRGSLRVYVATVSGILIVDARSGPAPQAPGRLAAPGPERLTGAEGKVVEYRALDGERAMGSAQPLLRETWLTIAELPVSDAYAQVNRLRNLTLLVVAVMLGVVGLLAYLLGTVIARPLSRLTGAAAKVKSGDLSVDLPAGGHDEIGYLTQVFNDMVVSLRQSREQLEQLSNTDGLTGLANRRHLMAKIETEIERAKRTRRPIAVLMLDVDHFKRYNDAHGHLAGDEVLRRVGAILRQSTRHADCPGRFGGEEFLVLVSEGAVEDAKHVGERIRHFLRKESFTGGPVTMSIGIAEYPLHGETADRLIESADKALYVSKRDGRDRVTVAVVEEPTTPVSDIPTRSEKRKA